MDVRHLLNEKILTGYWDWNMQGTTPFDDIDFLEQLGYNSKVERQEPVWLNKIFENDRQIFIGKLKQHIETHAKTPFVQEMRLQFPDNKVKYLIFTGRIVQWENTTPLFMTGTYLDVTSRREEHKQFLQTKDLLEKTNEVARVGGWELDVETDRVTWSAVTKVIFGVEPDFEPKRGSASTFFKEGKDREALVHAADLALHHGTAYDLELKVVNARGQELWTRTIGQADFENGKCVRLFGVFQDITEHKIREEQLMMRKEQMEKFISSAPVAIAMFDHEMNYMAASAIWMASYNLDIKSIIGKNHFDVFTEIPGNWKEYLRRCLQGEVIRMEEDSFVRRDGKTEWLRWEIRPWNETADIVGGIIMYTELITEKKRVQEELIRAKEQAEEAVLTKSRFLSVMSHEIRTPMNAVIGFTNLLLDSPRPDQIEFLKPLKYSADNLLVLINDILNLSKIEEGMVSFEHVNFNLRDLLQNIYYATQQFTAGKDINYKVTIDENIPAHLLGDSVRLGQIISNLANNAIKFTRQGIVDVKATLIEESAENATIGFFVTDTGIGIPADKQEYIFEIFTQASSETTREYGGTGLGLAISKRLVEMMGGKIQLQSKPGKGSVFSFELKFEKTRPENIKGTERREHARENAFDGIKVLIIEDNPLNVLLLKKYLQQWGITCDVAENGKIGLTKVAVNEYDLILLDLQMPVMDGYETARHIRAMDGDHFKNIFIIALTASMIEDIKDQIVASGINDALSKPFNYADLYDKIKNIVQKV